MNARTHAGRQPLSDAEVNRRLARVYEMALAAADREEYQMELTTEEARQANKILLDAFGAELFATREAGES
jgi:hypothetical protein